MSSTHPPLGLLSLQTSEALISSRAKARAKFATFR